MTDTAEAFLMALQMKKHGDQPEYRSLAEYVNGVPAEN
jgi:hypothetical protein